MLCLVTSQPHSNLQCLGPSQAPAAAMPAIGPLAGPVSQAPPIPVRSAAPSHMHPGVHAAGPHHPLIRMAGPYGAPSAFSMPFSAQMAVRPMAHPGGPPAARPSLSNTSDPSGGLDSTAAHHIALLARVAQMQGFMGPQMIRPQQPQQPAKRPRLE